MKITLLALALTLASCSSNRSRILSLREIDKTMFLQPYVAGKIQTYDTNSLSPIKSGYLLTEDGETVLFSVDPRTEPELDRELRAALPGHDEVIFKLDADNQAASIAKKI